MNKKVILFDIDYTLFDTTKFKKLVAAKIASIIGTADENFYELLEDVYYKARFNNHFEPSLFPVSLKEKFETAIADNRLENIWFDKDLIMEAMYPETISVLKTLQEKQIPCGVFSTGNSEFQLAKISSVMDLLSKNHLHIFSNKEEKLTELLDDYQDYKIYLVDDFVNILARAKTVHKNIVTVWIKRGKFAENAKVPEKFEPEAIIYSLDEILDIIE